MATTRKSPTTGARSRSPKRFRDLVQKPSGAFHPRVQKVGPEHFAIVACDCAKARSKILVCDFYGNVLVEPTVVAHNRPEFDAAIARVRDAFQKHDIRDSLVAVERTGRYHHAIQRAFAAAGFETRTVHPFATKQHRQPSDPGNKTDDTDLAALFRAAVSGFALIEAKPDLFWRSFQLLNRQRRDLVFKSSALCCQIREHLDAALPGFAACFDNLWGSDVAQHLLRHFDSAAALNQAGSDGLRRSLHEAHIRFQQRTLDTVLVWADQAAAPDLAAASHRRIALALDDDRLRKRQEILGLERELAHELATTPYVLLLSFPGIHVVSAAEFAGEMGPIQNYANARAITGRAGLFPSRYQSDRVDHANGPLVRCANRRLRATILGIADNLLLCNQHFRVLSTHWRAAAKDPRHSHVKVASRFCRIAFQMVAGRQVFHHPCLQKRGYIVDKLLAFHVEHGTPSKEALSDLQSAIQQIPAKEHKAEAQPLAEELADFQQGRKRGPQLLRDILPLVLARLGVGGIQSAESGAVDPT